MNQDKLSVRTVFRVTPRQRFPLPRLLPSVHGGDGRAGSRRAVDAAGVHRRGHLNRGALPLQRGGRLDAQGRPGWLAAHSTGARRETNAARDVRLTLSCHCLRLRGIGDTQQYALVNILTATTPSLHP